MPVSVVGKGAVQPSHVDQNGIGAELLATHRVAAACYGDRHSLLFGVLDNFLNLSRGFGSDNSRHPCAVQPRMYVVDELRFVSP
jgi:hypothetical protein